MKKWQILGSDSTDLFTVLLKNRGLNSKKEIQNFLKPTHPGSLDTLFDKELDRATARIKKAIKDKESIVVYADYDADGITAGAIMWEAIYKLGARVMPYIPDRKEEGYGLSQKGIDRVREQFDPSLIITVDHGITAWEKVLYAKKFGIEVIVTDHHVKPKKLPDSIIVHTTAVSGAGVSWFVAKELVSDPDLSLAAIGTIADMMPLVGANRSIAKFGLEAINKTNRVGLDALLEDAGISKGIIGTYEISHMISPRLNAMGRIEHALDALRLLCTNNKDKARIFAQTLGLKNRERQQMTTDTTLHALRLVPKVKKKLLFVAHESYNPGVIGLVAGRLVEEYYLPAVVVSIGAEFSKASARSIAGFNIVEALRSATDILVDVGGHPMAAGFTVETKNLKLLQSRLEELAEKQLDPNSLTRSLTIDAEIPLDKVDEALWQKLRVLEPFGFGNPEPVFATNNVTINEARLVGADGKHLKLRINGMDAIAFGFGKSYGELQSKPNVDIAYTIDMNHWNGTKRLQLKIKDIHIH